MTESTVAFSDADVREAFPVVDPGAKPLGARILVQMRLAKKKLSSGIYLPPETRDSMEPWPEGSWCEVGDFLRVPKWTGDRWTVRIGDTEDEVEFMIMNDHEVIAKVTGNPLDVKAFV